MASHGRSRALTEDDLIALPDDGYRHELQAGLLLAEPLPMPRHAWVQSCLLTILNTFVRQHGLGRVFGEMGFVLARNPDTIRGPDISFIARERIAAIGDGQRFVVGAPDLAIEILSPSNRPEAMHAKIADYLAAGSRLVWVVDPKSHTVTVYRTLLAPHRLGAEATLEGEDVIPGFSVPVATIFDE